LMHYSNRPPNPLSPEVVVVETVGAISSEKIA
jgi:hypothetical protein